MTRHEPPTGIVAEQLVWLNPGPPQLWSEASVTGTMPVFERRICCESAAPVFTGPNESEPALSAADGVPPSPRNWIETDGIGEFGVPTTSVPVTTPDAGGVNLIVSEHDAFGASVAPQFAPSNPKVVEPLTWKAPTTSGPGPMFFNVTVFVTLTPALRTPKSRGAGESSPYAGRSRTPIWMKSVALRPPGPSETSSRKVSVAPAGPTSGATKAVVAAPGITRDTAGPPVCVQLKLSAAFSGSSDILPSRIAGPPS